MPTKSAPERQRAGYEYFDEKLESVHTTSVPKTDQEAFEYVAKIESWFARYNTRVRFIAAREFGEGTYLFLPVEVTDGNVHLIPGKE